MTTQRVLLTSGTSLLAAHCVAALLEDEIAVRVMVSALPRAADVREMVAATPADPNVGLGFVEADLDDDGLFDALSGCDAIVHVEEESVTLSGVRSSGLPTTLRVLKAAAETQVSHVIILRRLDAESADLDSGSDAQLTVIHHALPFGPALTPEHMDALEPLPRMMSGHPRYLLPRRYRFVDVRDIAQQVVTALDPDATVAVRTTMDQIDPELLMLGLVPQASSVPEPTPAGSVAEPTDGQVRLPGWTVTERQLAKPLRDRVRRLRDSVPGIVAPRWWVKVHLHTAALLRRRSRFAPTAGPALVLPNRSHFPRNDTVTRATNWHPTPSEVTIGDAIASLVDLDEESRSVLGSAASAFLSPMR